MSKIGLLALPTELFLEIVQNLNGPSLLALLQVAKSISEILDKRAVTKLRRIYREVLLHEENRMREDFGIKLSPQLEKIAWWDCDGYLGAPFWGTYHGDAGEIAHLPCYRCLAWQPRDAFSTAMGCGPLALGQSRAHERLCIGSGVATGFYRPGGGMAHVRVCESCKSLVHPISGARVLPPRYERGKPVPSWDNQDNGSAKFHYWWDHWHRCWECTRGEDVRESGAEERRRARIIQRYALATLTNKERRIEKGLRLRRERGLTIDEVESIDLSESPAAMALRYPKYKPTGV